MLITSSWVTQSVKYPTLDLTPDLDLTLMNSSAELGTVLGMESTLKNANKNIQRLEDIKLTYL